MHLLKLIIADNESRYEKVDVKTHCHYKMKYLKFSIVEGIYHVFAKKLLYSELECLSVVKLFVMLVVILKRC